VPRGNNIGAQSTLGNPNDNGDGNDNERGQSRDQEYHGGQSRGHHKGRDTSSQQISVNRSSTHSVSHIVTFINYNYNNINPFFFFCDPSELVCQHKTRKSKNHVGC